MANPLVSVVMPTYNHSEFIGEAIECVLNQTYSNLELIIVDNFSEDQTAQVIASYKDSRIKYVQYRNNGIIAASRNHGIQLSQGEYVAFLDSDDLWVPEKLEWQVKALQLDPQRGLSFCRFAVKSDSELECQKVMGPKVDELPDQIYARLIKANFVVSSSTVVSSQALGDVGVFDESPELRCSEDFDLWLRIARAYKIAYVNRIGGSYRVHATQQSGDDLRLKRALAVIAKHEKNAWISSKYADKARASFYFQVGWVLVDQQSKLARSHLSQAIKLDPGNLKIRLVSCVGYILTFFPGIYRFLLNHRIDQKVSQRTINPQNL